MRACPSDFSGQAPCALDKLSAVALDFLLPCRRRLASDDSVGRLKPKDFEGLLRESALLLLAAAFALKLWNRDNFGRDFVVDEGIPEN